MLKVIYNGRLGNNIIQYFAARFFAEKHNLFFDDRQKTHTNYDWEQYFKIPNYNNTNTIKILQPLQIVDDNNFFNLLNANSLPPQYYQLQGYFQNKLFLHQYLSKILNLFNIKYELQDRTDVFVSYRIGDINNTRSMLPKEYFEEALESIEFRQGYISSDSPEHPFVVELANKYKLKTLFFDNPLDQINFAKNFNQLILSEGTFNWWTGVLSKANIVIYNNRNFQWFGNEIFHFDHWKQLNWDYDESGLSGHSVREYKPIKLKL